MVENSNYVPVAQIDKRIAEIREQLARLPIELEALERIRADAVSLSGSATSEYRELSRGAARPGAKCAVLRLLQKEKLSTKEVISRLEGQVLSAASDVRKVLYSTVFNLKRDGLIETTGGLLGLSLAGIRELEKLSDK